MNRHARRAAAAQKKQKKDTASDQTLDQVLTAMEAASTRGGAEDDSKSKLVLHTDPEDATATPECLALFLATATQAFSTARKIPGITFPVHIIVESGGARVCGTVDRDDGANHDEPFVVNKMVH